MWRSFEFGVHSHRENLMIVLCAAARPKECSESGTQMTVKWWSRMAGWPDGPDGRIDGSRPL
jgi:hypothetical protein